MLHFHFRQARRAARDVWHLCQPHCQGGQGHHEQVGGRGEDGAVEGRGGGGARGVKRSGGGGE